MEKTKVLCLILAIVLASAGTAGVVMGFGGETSAPVLPDNAINTIMDKPEEGTPADRSAIENLYIAQGELQRKGGFVGTTRGSTTSAGIKQEVINNRVVVGGNVFKEMITVGIVKNAYQLFMYNGNYLYRKFDSIKSASNIKWADTASRYGEADFLEKFGHRSDSLTGYILNDETIENGILEKEDNGLFQYRYILNIEKAPARMLREMKTNSNMNDYSTYVKAEIIVVMDANWQVKTVTTDCKYKVPMFGGVDCVEDITETFSDLNGQELPEKNFFEQFFDADIQVPVDKDPDALSILMDMFAPYIGNGNSLNASIVATNNGQSILSGLVSAKIDIENIENIEVAAKIGSDLYVEYQQGSVYVTYQDFKASTTVDGIMGLVDAFMPQASATEDSEDETENDILSKFTYSIENGVCTVSLPLDLGEDKLELNIYAKVTEDGYQFENANVTLGSLEINVELTNAFEVPERSGEYREILGLLDLVQNGVVYGNVNAFGFDLDVMYDVAASSLYATSDNLSVIYQNNAIYAEFGAIKAKLAISDVERIMTMLRLAGIVDDSALELPQMSVEQIIALLGEIKAVETDNGVMFNLAMDDLSASIYLAAADSGWNVDKVVVELGENVITLAMTRPTETEIPDVDDSQYADVMELIETFVNPIASVVSASSYGAEFDFDVNIDNVTYNVIGSFAYDVNKNIKVNAVVSNGSATLVKANAVVVDNVVYLDVNGLKTAFKLGEQSENIDISQIANGISGVNDTVDGIIEAINGIVERIKSLDISAIDFNNLIKQFAFNDGELALTVNADFIGLGNIDVSLSADRYNNLIVGIGGLNVANVVLNASAKILPNVGDVKTPNASDYILNLKGSVEEIEFAVSADLLNMDISASIDMLDNTVLVRYVDGKIYARIGEIAVAGTIDNLGALVSKIMSVMGVDASAIDFGNLTNIDLSMETLINAISINLDGALKLEINLEDIANVAIEFDNNADFAGITANVKDYTVNVELSDTRVPQLDVGNVYIPVELLADQVLDIYESFKNVAKTGISAEINTIVTVGNVAYTLTANVEYNNGLHLDATVADNVNKLITLDMYLVNNVIYIDVNGVRIATELPETDSASSDEIDLATVLGMLSKAKGYNEVLDSVIAVIEQLPNKLSNLDYVALVTELTYSNNVLSTVINGELLGLSKFGLTLSGSDNVTATINGLTIGGVTVNSLTVNASPACAEVAAPTSEYVTELELEVMNYVVTAKLDLLNKTVIAKTTLLGHELGLYYKENTVYVSYGAVNAKLNIADIDELLAVISTFIEGGIPSVEMPSVDVHDVLNSLGKVSSENGYSLKASIAGVNVTLSFDANAKLTDACVNVNDMDISATVVNNAEYPVFNLNDDYVDITDLLNQVSAIYDNYKNVIENGIAVDVNTNVTINDVEYKLTANVEYHNGLHLVATVAEVNGNKLVTLDMYLVDNVVYLDVNGVRIAAEIPAMEGTAANTDIASILGVLSQAKGYNEVFDSVIAVIEQLPNKLGNLDYVALVTELTYSNNVLSASIDGELLGLSKFGLTLSGTDNVTAVINGLTIGGVTVNSLTVNAAPACAEVSAPTSEYVTELELEVMNYVVTAKLDLLNKTVVAKTTLLDHELGLYYKENTVYVSYGAVNAKLNIADIDELLAVISTFIEGGIPSVEMPSVDVHDVLNSLGKVSSENGYSLKASIAGVNVTLSFDANAKLTDACVNVNDMDISATVVNNAEYPVFNLNADYVDLLTLAQTYAQDVRDAMNAEGYALTLNGSFAFDNNVYYVEANVIYSYGLYVNANVSYNTANMLNVELWYVDNTLYVSMGELKLAVEIPQNATANGSGALNLAAYKGYNPYVDGILDVVQGVIDKFNSGSIDYVALIGGLTFTDGELTLNVNGEQFGVGLQSLKLTSDNGLKASVNGFKVDRMTADFDASVKASSAAVTAPKGDFTTNLSIKIDANNTLYANLDLINGVYNFHLDDLYITYADNIVKLNKGDIYVSGNINQIIEYVKKIDDLVNEFSGAAESTVAKIDFDMFKNIDVKAIASSFALSAVKDKATLSLQAFGLDISAVFAYGKLHTVTVPVELIGKTLEIEPAKPHVYDKFNGEHEYIQIENVLDEYYPVIEKLVHTNSWKFSFDDDAMLSMGEANYKIAAGSYFEFYYKNTEGMNTFKLRAKLNVYKYKGLTSDKAEIWQPFMNVDIVYKDGNIYITDTGRLADGKKEQDRNTIKLTVSVDTLAKCVGLYDDIVKVVPQIGELVDNMIKAMNEAESNAAKLSYANILTDVAYNNGVFSMALNGTALLSKLYKFNLSAQQQGDGLSLDGLEIEYDSIAVSIKNLRVYASEVVDVDGKAEYATVVDINAYDTTGHMDFNSLYELLNSFVITATPAEENDGARSFYIDGTAAVTLALGNWEIADIPIGLSVKVDIDKNNKVFITAKVHRTEPEGAVLSMANFFGIKVYEDKGGDSYLYYDGVNETFTVIRNCYTDSYKGMVYEVVRKYCSACGGNVGPKGNCLNHLISHGKTYYTEEWGWVEKTLKYEDGYGYHERNFAAENLTTEQFTAGIVDYILEMFNFGSVIKNPIVEAMNTPNNNDFGVEDILSGYNYSAAECKYNVTADLTYISDQLGTLTVDILHKPEGSVNAEGKSDAFSLTNLNVSINMLNGMCKAKVPLQLKESTIGEATAIVQQIKFW